MKSLKSLFLAALFLVSCGDSKSSESDVQKAGGQKPKCPSCGPIIDGAADIITNEPRCWTSWVCTRTNSKGECTKLVPKTVCGGGGGGGKHHAM